MILGNKVQVKKYSSANDGYGGVTKTLLSTFTAYAKVNVVNDELRPLPSGYGYYRIMVIITNSESNISIGDELQYNNVKYNVVQQVPYKNERFSCYKAYEV